MIGERPASPAWQRRLDARRLAWPGASQLARLQQVLQEADEGWRAAWGIVPADTRVACRRVDEAMGDLHLQALGHRPGGAAWIHWSEPARRPLFAGCGSTAALALGASAACHEDRAGRLAGALRLERPLAGETPGAPPAGRWSGTVVATLPCGSQLLADAGLLADVCDAPPRPAAPATALVPAFAAAAPRVMRVQARLSDCTLDLGSLQGLQLGDLVRFDHRIDAPLLLHPCDGGAPLFRGFLAGHRGFKAVELSGPPSTHPTQPEAKP